MNDPRSGIRVELVRDALLLACIAALGIAVLAVLRPFLPAILWAAIIVVATWPLMLRVQRMLGGRRMLAVAVMSGGLFVVIVAPVALLLGTLVARLPDLREFINRLFTGPWPGPPDWLARLPYGSQLADSWQQAAQRTPEDWAATIKPYVSDVALWLSHNLGTLGGIALDFFLMLVLVVGYYLHGEALADRVQKFAQRVGGARGVDSVVLACQAMRAVAAGVVVTALVESVLSGFGLWMAGIPAAGLLTSIMFVLAVMQFGVLPVLVPAALWLVFKQELGWAVALGVWAGLMSAIDSLLRSWLIQRGAHMSFMLVLGGVLGGLLAFGIAGIFIGPVLLAVAQRIMDSWMDES